MNDIKCGLLKMNRNRINDSILLKNIEAAKSASHQQALTQFRMDQACNPTFEEHHPISSVYLDEYYKAMDLVTKENIQTLLPSNIQLHTIDEKKDSEGVINCIYYLNDDLLLRVHNTHKFWRGYVRENHVAFLTLVKRHTTIPLPEIISHGHFERDGSGFEYIIFRKLQGTTTLSQYLREKSELPEAERIELAKQVQGTLLDYIKQFQSVTVPQTIGSLRIDGSQAGMVNDGPRVGPFTNLRKYLIELVSWCQKELEFINGLVGLKIIPADQVVALEVFTKIEKLLKYLQQTTILDQTFQFYLCHNDLNPSNILVDQHTGKIEAILDWDAANIFVPIHDISFSKQCIPSELKLADEELSGWFESEIGRRGIKTVLSTIYQQVDPQIVKIVNLVDPLKYSCFWVNNWWKGESDIQHTVFWARQTELVNFDEAFQQFEWNE